MERATFASKDGTDVAGELALPPGEGPAPGLVVIQEYWGVNDHIRSIVARLAEAGFVALAPDLYRGKVTKDSKEAEQLMKDLDGARALADIEGAVEHLRAHRRCSGKIGVIGFCLGGAYAITAATRIAGLGAVVPFYGIPPADRTDPTRVPPPILMHVGAHDAWVTPAKAQAVQTAVRKAGGTMELCVYEAGHAFMNDTRPEAYDFPAARLAWDRSVVFLHKHLG